MIDGKTRARLRSEAQKVPETLQVGKGGITDTLITEMKDQLERRRLIKVGLNRSATHEVGKGNVAEELATRSGGELVEVRGNTAVYWKRGSSPTRPKA